MLTLLNIWEEVCVREKRRDRGGQTYFGNIKFPDKLQTATTFPYCQYQDLHSMYNLAACLQFFVYQALIPHDMLHICQRFILVKNFVFSNLYNLFKTLSALFCPLRTGANYGNLPAIPKLSWGISSVFAFLGVGKSLEESDGKAQSFFRGLTVGVGDFTGLFVVGHHL